jgi:hypothetical protein
MTTHPIHELFTEVDIETTADGTVLQRELRCNYCQTVFQVRRHRSGDRQDKSRVIQPSRLCNHMRRKCNHSNDDILSVASAVDMNDALARVVEIKAQGRPWPPPPTSARDQPTMAASAASQSPTPWSPCSTSTLQPDERVSLSAYDASVSSLKRRRAMSGAVPGDSPSSVAQHDRPWVYLVDSNGRIAAEWDVKDVDAWRRHTPWGKNDDKRLNTLLGKLVCAAGCSIRLVASNAMQALANMVHPRAKVRRVSTFTRTIIHALAKEAKVWSNPGFTTRSTSLS